MVSEEAKIKKELLMELESKRENIRRMGGDENVNRQLKRGKLTARGRIDALLDESTFQEIGMFAINRAANGEPVPADGVITGYGNIDGKRVFIYAQDFTCAGGTLSETHAQKICHVLDMATKAGCPVIGINDSGGARIQDGIDALSGYGQIFHRNTIASGVIPQICAIIGPCAGGAVYSPALMDFVYMVKGISCGFITGPRIVKTVMGQDITEEELGGALVAQRKAGVVCRSEDSEIECLESIRELLSYLPSNNRETPPRSDYDDPPERVDEHIFDIIPSNSRRSYDMHRVIERIFDRHPDSKKNYYELFPIFATNMITCFARLNGHTVGVVANQPRSKAGAIDIDASDKASRFIRFCDAFNIPLVTLVDVPGYLPGTDQEWNGIIRHGAKLLYAYAEATVPKITLILRKAYGGAYIGMCSDGLGADCVLCWPSAEMAVMGAEGAAEIIYRRELEAATDKAAVLEEKAAEYRQKFANPYRAAEHLHVDDIIDPKDSRVKLIQSLETYLNKTESHPWKKHGIMPA
jgi:methylmalonyl-CoA decarboxylase subunit alpha